ncbi:MAG: hypothetical protein ABI720_05135, partial [Actinomycetes bacterium]
VALTVTYTVADAAKNAPVSIDDPGIVAGTVGLSVMVTLVLVVLLGALAFTQEFRYSTVTSTYLGEPRRNRVLVAKCLSLALSSVVITAATLTVSAALTTALVGFRDGAVTFAAQFWQMVAAGFFVLAAYGVIGVALGALVRNQIAAVVGVLVWMTVVEQIIISSFPAVGRWLPGGATWALLQIGPTLGLDGRLLSAPAGGLVLVGYTAAAVALALVVVPRRDVL